MTKRILSIMFSCLLIIGLAPALALANGPVTDNAVDDAQLDPQANPFMIELYDGSDRFVTANKIANAYLYEHYGPVEGVIIVAAQGPSSGPEENFKFADALSAAGLSGITGYPVVTIDGSAHGLTPTDRETLQAYVDNCVGDLYIIILGDENSVNSEVEYDLTHEYGTLQVRLAGTDRYDTNLLVYEYGAMYYDWDSHFAFIAKGTNFPDALSIAPFLAEHGSSLLLVDPKATSLTPRQLAVVANAATVFALGDANSVSNGVYNQAGCANRFGGSNRYETSAEICEFEIEQGLSIERVGVATGTKPYDALSCSSLLGYQNSAIILVDPAGANPQLNRICNYAEEGGFWLCESAQVFGDSNSVPATVYMQLTTAAGYEYYMVW